MKFNIRVYGILEQNDKTLVLKEKYKTNILTKFPGGGLEFGEGTLDCLKREFLEELNLDISKAEITHFYTLDYALNSAFNSQEQLLLIYYNIKMKSPSNSLKIADSIQEVLWLDKKELKQLKFTFDLDQKLIEKL